MLECEYNSNQGNAKLADIKKAVEAVLKSEPNENVSLYYRDLLNGPWYGYHEEEVFAPQSLLKLPTVIAYYKLAEENPNLLDEEIDYGDQIPSNLPSDQQLTPSQTYPVEVLLERTLQLSDNVAFNLLVEHLPTKYLRQVHEDLNIPFPSEETPEDFISVRSYSSIFRVLYNSSYLSRKYSEHILALLAESDFAGGLVAGVPQDVVVAHKFGLKNPTDEDPVTQLHDCGVVYHPQRPYLICIMTKGTDQEVQAKLLAELGKSVYGAVDQ